MQKPEHCQTPVKPWSGEWSHIGTCWFTCWLHVLLQMDLWHGFIPRHCVCLREVKMSGLGSAWQQNYCIFRVSAGPALGLFSVFSYSDECRYIDSCVSFIYLYLLSKQPPLFSPLQKSSMECHHSSQSSPSPAPLQPWPLSITII